MLAFNCAMLVCGLSSMVKAEASNSQTKSYELANFDVGTVICGILIFAAGAVTIAKALENGNEESSTESSTKDKLSPLHKTEYK
ncbi:hypothetical protein KGF57_001934 [Candida theae]|uniref:Uncharacterized protein n=1 Tax=Candida theae TaxID=1198502 RepID=A0AAD5BFZ3_9ASCO|nr:uncharacterized protein KGF57_001934 [Candida theae]KAI5960492.1 hypothetical protein KGF57_001934 [Candida theae]